MERRSTRQLSPPTVGSWPMTDGEEAPNARSERGGGAKKQRELYSRAGLCTFFQRNNGGNIPTFSPPLDATPMLVAGSSSQTFATEKEYVRGVIPRHRRVVDRKNGLAAPVNRCSCYIDYVCCRGAIRVPTQGTLMRILDPRHQRERMAIRRG